MRSLLSFAGRLLVLLATLGIFAVGLGVALVFSSVPDAREQLALPGLAAPVEVVLDADGIPRIAAQSERDAAMALGYLHARDRMFQMELMRRGAQGRLAEILGQQALRSDRFTRTLGLAQRAEADLATLSPEARDLLTAYAEGVNALITMRGRLAAPEFMLFGEPEPWKPEHSLLWAKVMGLWLSGNWRRDLERSRLAEVLRPEQLEALFPRDDSPGRPDLAAVAPEAARHAGLLRHVPAFGVDAPLPSSASNAWVVGPARSSSGAPILASDPHLGFQAPILWYLARIELPDGRFRAGATAPGVPVMLIGRNERLAWGFTTTHSDTQDVFVERLAGADAYETPDGPRPFALREEIIRIRGGGEERLRVRETRHGPVVSDLDGPPRDNTVVAVAMANLAPADTSADALLRLNRARSVAEARAAAALMSSPAQNLMVADADGRIALYLVGRTPVRRGGDGSLPARGWDGSGDWTGFVPFDSMPHAEDPAGGVLANANNRPAPAEGPVFLGRDWAGDWRFRRIAELLAARPRHDAAAFVAMQSDTTSLFAREVLPVLRAVTPRGDAARAFALLTGWEGEMAADRPQPLVFHAWMSAFGRLALQQAGVPEGVEATPEFLRAILRPGAAWCGPDGCTPLLLRALDQAAKALAEAHGNDPAAWRWGAAHVARFDHQVLRFIPGLRDLVALEVPTGGDGETISRGGFRGGQGFTHQHGAGFRGVFDLSDPDGALVMIATGQSGHPLSDHWGRLLQRWGEGDVVRLGRQPEQEGGRIRLLPCASGDACLQPGPIPQSGVPTRPKVDSPRHNRETGG
jgi:penicillin amidase